MSTTLLIIIITAIISFMGFKNETLLNRLLLWPSIMKGRPAELYRLLTAGVVHADITHLAFNMITLYFFGTFLENERGGIGSFYFVLLYTLGIIVSCIPSYLKKQNQTNYRSLGASGGVAAIVFGMIYLYPWEKIYIFFAIGLPSIIYAVLYLVYSAYMARSGKGYVNHDAHFWGSIFGIVFMLIIDPSHGQAFWQQLIHPKF